jgi:hypothetical protein
MDVANQEFKRAFGLRQAVVSFSTRWGMHSAYTEQYREQRGAFKLKSR